MQTMITEQQIKIIAARITGQPVEAITLDSSWRSLGMDSLDLFELLMQCEMEFSVTIPDSEAIHFHHVGDVVHFLAQTLD